MTTFATHGFTIPWTNAAASNDYEIMRSDDLTADWYPAAYGLAHNPQPAGCGHEQCLQPAGYPLKITDFNLCTIAAVRSIIN
jgi:hypothetical protein